MSLKAGVVQFSPLYGRVVDNLHRLGRLVAEGGQKGARLLVLPEMTWTGYLWPRPSAILPFAEKAGEGPGQKFMADLAQKHGLWLAYGFPEQDGDRLYNSQGLAGPEGTLYPVYRKTHLFDADQWWAQPGDTGYRQWPSPWGTVGSGICMDLNFPDLADYHGAQGTALLAFSTNWLDQDFDVIPYWEEKLSGSDGVGFRGWGLFANRGGQEFGVAYRGQSSIFHDRQCVATLPGKEDGVLVVETNLPTI